MNIINFDIINTNINKFKYNKNKKKWSNFKCKVILKMQI